MSAAGSRLIEIIAGQEFSEPFNLSWDVNIGIVYIATITQDRVRLDIATAGAVVGGEGLMVDFRLSTDYIEVNAENF